MEDQTIVERSRDRQDELHELAIRAKSGDASAMEQLLRHADIKNVIYHTANQKVGAANADDVYQQVCEIIWKKLDTWQEQSKISSWVKRVTFNACMDFLRKTKPYALFFTETLPSNPQEPEQHAYILDQEKAALLARALESLGQRCRQLLTLFLIEGRQKNAIMQAVQLKKSAFHDAFNACCHKLEKKIRKFL